MLMDEQQDSQADPNTSLMPVFSNNEQSLNPVSVAVPPKGSDGSITWTASEFVYHQKNAKWYLVFFALTVVLSGGLWLLMKNLTTIITIVVAAVALVYAATKKPRELEYKIDGNSLSIANKSFPLAEFKSFTVVHQDGFSSLVFSPLKRFNLSITIYYDPADEQKILDLLSSRVPMEEKKRDWIDQLMWKIRY